MCEQLELDLGQVKNVIINNEADDEDEDSQESIVYKKRLKDLIHKIAESEKYDGIQCTKEGIKRLEETSKYLISVLMFEILSQMKINGRKQIRAEYVDNALDNILAKSSAIDIVLNMLDENIEKLKSLDSSTSVSKASKFINEDM